MYWPLYGSLWMDAVLCIVVPSTDLLNMTSDVHQTHTITQLSLALPILLYLSCKHVIWNLHVTLYFWDIRAESWWKALPMPTDGFSSRMWPTHIRKRKSWFRMAPSSSHPRVKQYPKLTFQRQACKWCPLIYHTPRYFVDTCNANNYSLAYNSEPVLLSVAGIKWILYVSVMAFDIITLACIVFCPFHR